MKKIPPPVEQKTHEIPINAPSNRQESSEIHLIFERAQSKHCQLTTPIDLINQDFLFGNMHGTQACAWVQPLPPMFGLGPSIN